MDDRLFIITYLGAFSCVGAVKGALGGEVLFGVAMALTTGLAFLGVHYFFQDGWKKLLR